LRNRAVTDTFEPGSTLKPFTIALRSRTGKVRSDTVINCAPGRLTIGNATISDAHPHGALSVAEVIQKSSNVGAAKIAAMLSRRRKCGRCSTMSVSVRCRAWASLAR
jgi:cell division protein FtsI (penicillin-binding protein 3)